MAATSYSVVCPNCKNAGPHPVIGDEPDVVLAHYVAVRCGNCGNEPAVDIRQSPPALRDFGQASRDADLQAITVAVQAEQQAQADAVAAAIAADTGLSAGAVQQLADVIAAAMATGSDTPDDAQAGDQ